MSFRRSCAVSCPHRSPHECRMSARGISLFANSLSKMHALRTSTSALNCSTNHTNTSRVVQCRPLHAPASGASVHEGRVASQSTASTSRPVSSCTHGPKHQQPRAVATAAAAPETAQASTSQPVDYFATDKRPIILFDGVCNLCNGGVNLMLDWDKQGVYRLAALQSNPGRQLLVRCGRAPDDISSIVLVEEGQHYIKSDAILRIASRLMLPMPLVAAALMPFPYFVKDTFYDQIANNRYNIFGKSSTCRVSSDGFQDRFLGA